MQNPLRDEEKIGEEGKAVDQLISSLPWREEGRGSQSLDPVSSGGGDRLKPSQDDGSVGATAQRQVNVRSNEG